jgi:polyphosphate kinase
MSNKRVQSDKFTPRDLSWLDFNYRVLQEAMDDTVPLYEQIKFLAIYSSNLDEFFRVRIAFLRSFKEMQKSDRKRLLTIKPKSVLRKILERVDEQQSEFGQIFRGKIIPKLKAAGIHLVKEHQLTEAQFTYVIHYFREKVAPLLTQAIYQDGEPPFLEDHKLYFVLDRGEDKAFHVINIPSDKLDRFLVLPSDEDQHYIIYLDDLIRAALPIWQGTDEVKAYSVKVTRDAELYIEDEYSGDLLEKIKASLDARNTGLPTRFLFDQVMPERLQKTLRKAYGLSRYDLIPGSRYHNFNDFFGFPDPLKQERFHYKALPPVDHPELAGASSLMDVIRQKDQLLHFPYQKYNYVPDLIHQAAKDPNVTRLRITLYRVASKSTVVKGLLLACENGIKVEVFVEAKARFDEASNLFWGGELEKAGATVRYSFPGIKVHTKLLLIETKNKRDIAYLGTGNFNEKTALIYADHALLTAAESITRDVKQVFDLLAGKLILPNTSALLVAPFDLREKLKKKIDREIKQAKAGKPAEMILKMNSLEERGMIEKLYEASRAGVKIQLIIRGICCLVPGVPGQSENIEVISILDRFLEHARIFYFYNAGDEELYTASADWMNRNLFRRIEVAMPINDPSLREEMKKVLAIQLADNTKARLITAEGGTAYRSRPEGEPKHRAQQDLYDWLASRES